MLFAIVMRRFCFFGLLFLLFFLFGGLVGCPSTPPAACQEDGQCAKGMICRASECVIGCRKQADCLATQSCLKELCVEAVCTPGTSEDCYDGPKETADKGLCRKGKRFCLEDGQGWSPCVLQQVPQAEKCDKEDNDCNGQIDDGLATSCACKPGSQRQCFTGSPATEGKGVCVIGWQFCTLNSEWSRCGGQVLPEVEVCDALDNDCNGKVDDGIDCGCKDGETRDCAFSQSACKKGKQVCEKGTWGTCEVSPVPTKEVCDGKDNDCDGIVDNIPGTSDPLIEICYTAPNKEGLSSPCNGGLRVCTKGKLSPCEGEVLPRTEACNGIDDDCDGQVDEGLQVCEWYACNLHAGDKLVSVGEYHLYDNPTGVAFDNRISSIAFQKRSGDFYVLMGTSRGTINAFQLGTDGQMKGRSERISAPGTPATVEAISGRDTLLAAAQGRTSGTYRVIRLFRAGRNQNSLKYEYHPKTVTSLLLLPSLSEVLVAFGDGALERLQVVEEKGEYKVQPFDPPRRLQNTGAPRVNQLVLSRDGSLLYAAVTGLPPRVSVWKTSDWSLLTQYYVHDNPSKHPIGSVAAGPVVIGKAGLSLPRLLTGDDYGTVKYWTIQPDGKGSSVFLRKGDGKKETHSLGVSRGGGILAYSLKGDPSVYVYDKFGQEHGVFAPVNKNSEKVSTDPVIGFHPVLPIMVVGYSNGYFQVFSCRSKE